MDELNARSSISGYLALGGIWVLLAALFVWCAIFRTASESAEIAMSSRMGMLTVAAFCAGVACVWCAWLRGFRLRVVNGEFEYRNGLYQTRRARLGDIQNVGSKQIRWRLLWRKLSIPRMVIELRDAPPIVINVKPFSRSDLARLRAILSK
jgi:hypothetical protein